MKEQSCNDSGLFYGYFVVAASFIIMLGVWSAYYAFGVFFKPLLNEFGWTRAMTSGAFSLATINSGFMSLAMGWLTDRVGPRPVMTVCGLFLGLGYFLMSSISAIWHFYLFFGVIVGIGMSGSFVPIMSTVPRWFVSKRNLMTGIVASGIGGGGFIGPPVASWMISNYGWRMSYVIMSGVVILLVVLSAQIIKRDPAQVGLQPYGGKVEDKLQSSPEDEDISLRKAVLTSQFWLVFGNMFCFGLCVFSIMVHISPHAIELGMSPFKAANILALVGGFGIAGKIILGRAGDVVGSRMTLILGFILMSTTLIFLVPVKSSWALFLFACVFGFAFGGCAVSHPPLVASLFGLNSLGMVFGLLNFGFSSGGAIGPLFTGLMFDSFSSYRLAFTVLAIFSFIGLILMVFLKSGRVRMKK